jgi:hypothetical protein
MTIVLNSLTKQRLLIVLLAHDTPHGTVFENKEQNKSYEDNQTIHPYCGSTAMLATGCKTMNRSQKGAAVGAGGGAAVGAVVGRALGNTAMGAIVGAAVGGTAGAVIGRKMDKQG